MYGRRGQRPYTFSAPHHVVDELVKIPGVVRAQNGTAVACAWDVAAIVAERLGVPPPPDPVPDLRAAAAKLPGVRRFVELGFHDKLRPYQKHDAVFCAVRHYAINGQPRQTGKTASLLAATVLIDAKRTLVLCPAIAKWNWAAQVARWLGEEALLLEGRGGDYAVRYCKHCNARGYKEHNGVRGACRHCRARNGSSLGYTIFDVNELQLRVDSYVLEYREPYVSKKTGKINAGALKRRVVEFSPLPRTYTCTKHPAVAATAPGKCTACQHALYDAIEAAKIVISNWDIITPQRSSTAAGRQYDRTDLDGWCPALAQHHFTNCIGDELHKIRGTSTDKKKKGRTRRERACLVASSIPYVWGATGTFIYGYTRDGWGQLDFISGGLFGHNQFPYQGAYCNGHHGTYGWVADGKSDLADTELVQRLATLKTQKPRSEILPHMPPKIREVVWVEGEVKLDAKTIMGAATGDAALRSSVVDQALREVTKIKLPQVIEAVIDEMAEGLKAFVLVYHRADCEAIHKAFEAAIDANDVRTRMRQVDAKVWTAHGEQSDKLRFELARSYSEHKGAAVFVATMDSMSESLSLIGCSSVHFVDWHHTPGTMQQAEDRGFQVGVNGYAITHYAVRGSVDEHMVDLIVPKLEAQAKITGEVDAKQMMGLIDQPIPVDEIWARLLAQVSQDENDEL